tara:strand:- start:182 stop:370 length:189 start_codon:yes stop_codon:yes gene_type:complete
LAINEQWDRGSQSFQTKVIGAFGTVAAVQEGGQIDKFGPVFQEISIDHLGSRLIGVQKIHGV